MNLVRLDAITDPLGEEHVWGRIRYRDRSMLARGEEAATAHRLVRGGRYWIRVVDPRSGNACSTVFDHTDQPLLLNLVDGLRVRGTLVPGEGAGAPDLPDELRVEYRFAGSADGPPDSDVVWSGDVIRLELTESAPRFAFVVAPRGLPPIVQADVPRPDSLRVALEAPGFEPLETVIGISGASEVDLGALALARRRADVVLARGHGVEPRTFASVSSSRPGTIRGSRSRSSSPGRQRTERWSCS